ncbi:MAG: NADH-quinone oxidoreductase subunit NuoH [Verrucomicrobiae bacterium]|nr:NADH-quinone oxidoreductase subunit NuoH [Verrucomicrobiae bacterium]
MYETVDQMFVRFGDLVLGWAATRSPGLEPWARVLLCVGPIAILFPLLFAATTWAERKLLARIQNRLGPNRVGPAGLLQPVADGLKTLTKEDIVPDRADKLIHALAPILVMVPAFLVLAVLPMGRNMTAANLHIGVLFFFAAGSISQIAVFMAGWGSRNKYSLLGGMRAIAQMVSYEIPFILSALTVVMVAGTLSTVEIVESQRLGLTVASDAGWLPRAVAHLANTVGGWYILQPWGVSGFLIYLIAGLAELNRSPFDIPEGESEIIAGHHTEYSGFKFALFFMSEYITMVAVCGLGATLFLGGWQGPRPLPSWAWFFLKVFALMALMIWVRGSFPRMRVDQLMAFAWKFLLPLSLVNVLAAGLWMYLPSRVAAWFLGGALMAGAYFGLCRLVRPGKTGPRHYHYA